MEHFVVWDVIFNGFRKYSSSRVCGFIFLNDLAICKLDQLLYRFLSQLFHFRVSSQLCKRASFRFSHFTFSLVALICPTEAQQQQSWTEVGRFSTLGFKSLTYAWNAGSIRNMSQPSYWDNLHLFHEVNDSQSANTHPDFLFRYNYVPTSSFVALSKIVAFHEVPKVGVQQK